jgi:hypothetical protein
MKLIADISNHLLHWPTIDFALFYLARTSLNDLVPSLFCAIIHGIIETDEKLPGKAGTVLFGPSQHFGNFFRSNAHDLEYRTSPPSWQAPPGHLLVVQKLG